MMDNSWPIILAEEVTVGLSLPDLPGEEFHKLRGSGYLAHVTV